MRIRQADTLGSFLRGARKRRGLTLRAAAARLGVTPSYLSHIENDRRVPSHGVLKEIAGLLGVDLDDLLDLACRLDPETLDWLRRSPAALRLARTVARLRLGDGELAALEDAVRGW